MLVEEAGQLVEWNEVDPVIEIDVPGTLDPNQFLRLDGAVVGILAEFLRMGLVGVSRGEFCEVGRRMLQIAWDADLHSD